MGLIRLLIILLLVFIIVDAVLSYFPHGQNNEWAQKLRRFSDKLLNPLRRLFPEDMPFDVAPMIFVLGVLIILQLEVLVHFIIVAFIIMVIIDTLFSYFSKIQEQLFVIRYRKLISYALNPVRRFSPSDLNFDISPYILIIFLVLIDKLW